MYFIRTEGSFDGAHFLKGYTGKCSNIHGHRWRVIAEIQQENLEEEEQTRGMLADFSDLKEAVKEICDSFDHLLIYEEGSLRTSTVQALQAENFRILSVPFRPTAENFARHIYGLLEDRGYDVHRVEIYETPNNCAAYEKTPEEG